MFEHWLPVFKWAGQTVACSNIGIAIAIAMADVWPAHSNISTFKHWHLSFGHRQPRVAEVSLFQVAEALTFAYNYMLPIFCSDPFGQNMFSYHKCLVSYHLIDTRQDSNMNPTVRSWKATLNISQLLFDLNTEALTTHIKSLNLACKPPSRVIDLNT